MLKNCVWHVYWVLFFLDGMMHSFVFFVASNLGRRNQFMIYSFPTDFISKKRQIRRLSFVAHVHAVPRPWLASKPLVTRKRELYTYLQVSLPGLYPYFHTLDSSVWIHVLNHFPVEGTVTNTSTGAECSTCEAGGGGNSTWLGAMTM